MKKLFLYTLFLFFSFQTQAQEPLKKANLITFEAYEKKGFDLFKECVMILKKHAYTFESMDKDFLMLTTTPKKFDKTTWEFKLDISVTGNKVDIRSYVINTETYSADFSSLGLNTAKKESWERGAYRSIKGSIWREGWLKQVAFKNELEKAVKGSVGYAIEEGK